MLARRFLNFQFRPQKKQRHTPELKYRPEETSSETSRTAQFAGLQIPDAVLTPFRWDHVPIDFDKAHGLKPTDQGPFIGWSSVNHPIVYPIAAFLWFVSAAAGIESWSEEKHKARVAHEKNKNKHDAFRLEIQNQFQSNKEQINVDDLNKRIRGLSSQTPLSELEKKFFAKYQNAQIYIHNDEIKVDFSTKFKPINIILALFDTAFLAGVYYWDAWITMVVVTGTWCAIIPMTSLLVSVALPVAIATLTYLLPKFIHWVLHSITPTVNKLQTSEEAVRGDELLQCLLHMKELEEDKKTENARLYNIHAGAVGFMTGIIKTQYSFALLLVIMLETTKAISHANPLGIASFGISFLLAVKGYYDKKNELEDTVHIQGDGKQYDYSLFKPLQDELTRYHTELDKHQWKNEFKLIYYFNKFIKSERAFVQTLKYLSYDYFMTSAFCARLILIAKVTSPFVPDALHLTWFAAHLTTPAGLIVIALSALLWTGYRSYVKNIEINEKEANKYTAENYKTLEAKITVAKELDINKDQSLSVIARFSLGKFGIFSRCCGNDAAVEDVSHQQHQTPAPA